MAQAVQADGVELATQAPRASKLKPFILVLAGFVLAVGVTLGTLFFLGVLPPASNAASTDSQQSAAPSVAPAIYVDLDPEFTVSLKADGRQHFLQVAISAMTRDPGVETLIKRHMPAIRNDLMVLLGSQPFAELATRAGKERLQGEALQTIQKVLDAEGVEGSVETVYFTAFVMQ